jgi:hypothetical protein
MPDPTVVADTLVSRFSSGDHETAAMLLDPDAGFWLNGCLLEGWTGPEAYRRALRQVGGLLDAPALEVVSLAAESEHVVSGRLRLRGRRKGDGQPVELEFRLGLDVSEGMICGMLVTVPEADLRRFVDQATGTHPVVDNPARGTAIPSPTPHPAPTS